MKFVDPHLRTPSRPGRNYSTDEPMHPLQVAAYRRMTAAQKLDRLAEMYRVARTLMVAGSRMRHPEWSEEQVEREVRARMLYGVS